jgi:hypothetical protein
MKTELKRFGHIMIIFVHPILIQDYTVFKYGISRFLCRYRSTLVPTRCILYLRIQKYVLRFCMQE